MIKRKQKQKIRLLPRLLGAAAILVLLSGIYASWLQHKNNQTGYDAPEATGTPSEPAPSTEKPKDNAFENYQVPPDSPRYIFIPKISVRAMVKSVGVTANNQIESPGNVFDVGWFNKSAKPGQPGAVVMDGHISSWEANGVFHQLKDLEQGDTMTVERGDGTTFTYKVVESQTYDADKVDMVAALAPVNPDKPGLNLISCTGKVIKGTNDFDKRLVVFAEQI